MATLATRRSTSHSQGPRVVSSKSFKSNTRCDSGERYPPKFAIWASPHACTKSPVVGRVDKSAAMGRAAPRKKANGEAAMRRWRSGTRKDSRSASCWKMRSTASPRSGRTSHFPRLLRGSFCRQACPFCWDASKSDPRTGTSWVFAWRPATLCTSEEPVARLASPCPVSDLWSTSAFLPIRLLPLRGRP